MGKTELSARKQAVLAAVVKAYIQSGEPIGSKILTELLENSPSPATLRNEMNELCALGFLHQPHTSAGRVPTESGYRLYVDSLMKPAVLGESTKQFIDSRLTVSDCDPRTLPKFAAEVLCELTGLPAISCYPVDSRVYLKSAQLLPTGKGAAVLLIITSDGRTLSRACRIPAGYSRELASEFEKIFSSRLRRRPLNQFTRADLQGIVAAAGIGVFELTPVIALLFDMVAQLATDTVGISGSTELYNICGEKGARQILALAESGELLLPAVCERTRNTDVFFGNDIGLAGLSRIALVVSKYFSLGRYCGSIGIIGTGRMSYERIIPCVEYTAARLGEAMGAAAKDLED